MRTKTYRWLKYGFLLGLTLLLISIIISFSSIYFGVKKACQKARSEFSGDCQSALVQFIESGNHSFREKNTAVWALGQLADPKSIDFLEKLNSSAVDPENCDYDQSICLYEVQKAIKWSKNGNVTSWMYRNKGKW